MTQGKIIKNLEEQENSVQINVDELDFHPVLKDIENMFWFFLLSVRVLTDFEVQNTLRTKDGIQEGYLCFVKMLDKFNESTNLQIEKNGNSATSRANIHKEMVFIGKAMTILTYDFLLSSKYSANVKKDKEFQFLRHVRNGAAHGNKFNLKDEKGEWKIGGSKIIKWNGLEISRKLQDKEVFNNFISMNQVFLLAKYFSERLIEIDNEQS